MIKEDDIRKVYANQSRYIPKMLKEAIAIAIYNDYILFMEKGKGLGHKVVSQTVAKKYGLNTRQMATYKAYGKKLLAEKEVVEQVNS